MDDFWKAWAINEACSQWYIYYRDRGDVPPPVDGVDILKDPPIFRVLFRDGTVLDVAPVGIARPPGNRIR